MLPCRVTQHACDVQYSCLLPCLNTLSCFNYKIKPAEGHQLAQDYGWHFEDKVVGSFSFGLPNGICCCQVPGIFESLNKQSTSERDCHSQDWDSMLPAFRASSASIPTRFKRFIWCTRFRALGLRRVDVLARVMPAPSSVLLNQVHMPRDLGDASMDRAKAPKSKWNQAHFSTCVSRARVHQ